jgi:hypothetical protein
MSQSLLQNEQWWLRIREMSRERDGYGAIVKLGEGLIADA